MCSNSCRYYLKVASHSKCYVCRRLFHHVFKDVVDGININYGIDQVLQAAIRARVSLGSSFGWFRMSPALSITGDLLHMNIKVIPVISAIEKSHHNHLFKSTKKQSMKKQSIHVMNAFIKQDGRSSLQSIRNPT